MTELHVVTGAFGFTGKSITRRLLEQNRQVLTLTGHPGRPDEFGGRVMAAPYNFDRQDELTASLKGASVLYNTYWIRFPQGSVTFDQAIQNTKVLVKAARDAGISRIVHISITNPSLDSALPYFRGKAIVERAIIESGLSYTILRPAVIFGKEGILINNIAWFLRRFPIFAVPGSGEYHIQPIFVEDLAEMAVSLGGKDESLIVDAVGPETYSFNDLLRLIANAIGQKPKSIHMHPRLAFLLAKLSGYSVGDVILTWDEVMGLMADLLVSKAEPTGATRLGRWLTDNSGWLGNRYMSELERHYRKTAMGGP